MTRCQPLLLTSPYNIRIFSWHAEGSKINLKASVSEPTVRRAENGEPVQEIKASQIAKALSEKLGRQIRIEKRQIRNRLVYNDWGLYRFVQMLTYKCLHVGKELHIISERDTTKMCHVCKYKKDMPLHVRTYRCANCGLVMDRDENSAINIYERFLARLGPHTHRVECGVLHEQCSNRRCEHIWTH